MSAAEPRALFASELAALEDRLALPYPDRARLIDELAGDLGAVYGERRAAGATDAEARDVALRSVALDDASIHALEEVHTPAVRRALGRVPRPVRQWIEAAANAIPLAALFTFLVEEVPLSSFLRSGGPLVSLVFLFGALALFLEFQRFFVWFVLRDHSVEALRRNTHTPLYLAAATVLLGLLGAASKLFWFLNRLGNTVPPGAVLLRGLRDPLASVIVACALAALTVLVHSALAVGLRAIRIPDSRQKVD